MEPSALEATADGSPGVVLGTGLTVLDKAIALTEARLRTALHAVCGHAPILRNHAGWEMIRI
jgi:hypothetical protein